MQSEAYVALDQKYVSSEDFQAIYDQAEKVSRLDSGLITYLLDNESRQKKHNKRNKLNEPNQQSKLTQPNKHSYLGGT